MTNPASCPNISPEAYLAQEEQSVDYHEYIKGVIKLRPSSTPKHNYISGNLAIALTLALRKKPYAVFHVAQRLWIPSQQVYLYPDVMVTTKPLQLQDGRDDNVLNACFVAEVLAESTKNYDRSEKFQYYRSIPEFQEYLLIEQDRVYVEHYRQVAPQNWHLTEYTDLAATISLETVGLELAIADLYEDVEMEVEEKK